MCDAAFQSVAVGFFDGVHLGHQAILSKAESALTFSSHPLEVLRPEKAPRLIMSKDERLAAIGKPTTVLEFTRELASMSAEEFAEKYFKGKKVYSGANWTFGKGGVGNVDWLKAHGYEAEIVPYATYLDEPISSTRVRAALLAGDVKGAAEMMGRPYQVKGQAFKGKGKGKEIGFPTINLKPSKPMALKTGVYKVQVSAISTPHSALSTLHSALAIANFGYAPTFAADQWPEPTLEVHLLSPFPQPVPPTCEIKFIDFIREEKKFASVEELVAQIKDDIARVHS